ncbi:thioredoxin [Halocola ammonii]
MAGIRFDKKKGKFTFDYNLKTNNSIMAVELTDANFEELALKSDKPVLIDFWAEWCGPCRMVTPIVEEIATDYDGKAIVGKVNVDENPNISAKYGIRNIPTILFLKNGEIADKSVGAVPKNVLTDKMDNLL